MGASAACRGAGLVAGNVLSGGRLGEQELLELGASLEGHADNIAPALYGGCQIVAMDGRRVTRVPLPLAAGLRFVGFTPSFNMSTKKGRALLPEHLTRQDAVHNSCRSALLTAALATGRWEALATAVDDRLHQRPRSKLFPAMYEFFAAASAAGAYAAYLSGGGSTLMALSDERSSEAVRAAFERAARERGIGGRGYVAEMDASGAAIL